MIAWIDAQKTLQVTDRMATAKALPPLDRRVASDWVGLSGVLDNGRTMIEVSRALDTQDEDDVVFKPGLTRMIWAWGANTTLEKHVQRGVASVLFFGEVPPPPRNAARWDMRMSSVLIPSSTTSFFCQQFDLPADKNYQTIRVDPLISNPKLVHHIVVYSCPPTPASQAVPCSGMKAGCSSLLYAWAVGAPPLILPNNTGIPLRGGSAFMQVHYNNPDHISGVTDNSGVRFYYTDVLRPNEAGFLKLGVPVSDITIPAQRPAFGITNQCDLPGFPGTATILGSALHMHEIGTQIFSAVYREGRFVSTVGVNLKWDYNIQEIAMLPTPFIMKGGDVIQTTCVWAGGPQEVKGGESTSDEMCFNFLLYYPVTPFRGCSGESKAADFQEGKYPWVAGNEELNSIGGGSKARTVLIVLIVLVVIFVLVALPVFYLYRRHKQKKAVTKALRGALLINTAELESVESSELTVR
jgi:hypothetical protein